MRIERLTLHNWLRFKGEHELQLKPTVYAIVAREKDNTERSNFLGKTSLLEAVDFALWGLHRHRTEDAWITNGEPEGSVEIEFDDGVVITRARKRGKSTRLKVTSNMHGEAQGDEAQQIIVGRVGFDQDDYFATCRFEQRQMARLILARPDERMGVISAWLRMGPLQKAEEVVRDAVSMISRAADTSAQELRMAKEIESRELGVSESVESLETQMQETATKLETARGKLGQAQNVFERNESLRAAQEKIAIYDRLVKEGKELRLQIDEVDQDKLIAEYTKRVKAFERALETKTTAYRDLVQKQVLAQGAFDGKCPLAGIKCPAKDVINKDRTNNKKLVSKAEKAAEEALGEYVEADKDRKKWEATKQELERSEATLERLREHVRTLQPEVTQAKKAGKPLDPGELREQLTKAQNVVVQLSTKLETLRRSITAVTRAQAEQEHITTTLESLQKQLATHREAAVIFGKQGAQRRVAETALSEIETGANAMLRECGIDLSVEVQWSREGSGLAKVCEACGHPFPSSTRVKECERCATARGPLLVNKLDIVLSDRSGAAEDLAGAAIQLAASAWLRRERASAWSTALIDEPFSQLDAEHRRAFAVHLSALLGGRYGFAQALIISHNNDTAHMLPGRIEVVSDGKYSRPMVVA